MDLTLKYEVKKQVAHITFNRPGAFNSFNRAMSDAFIDALRKAEEDKAARAIFITGTGKAFCAGQDLKEVVDQQNNPGMKRILEEGYNPIIKLLRSIPKPIIAGVNGVAAGAGANIAIACDIVIASEKASFIQAFSKIGLIPDSGGTFFLPRVVGLQRATALMMLGDKISAEEAEKMGMIYKVFPSEVYEKSAVAIAEKLAKMPTQALALTKELINKGIQNDLHTQLQLEGEYQIKSAQSYDYKEGVAAFVEKRKPEFRGE